MRNTNFNTNKGLTKYKILDKMYDRLINNHLRTEDEFDEDRCDTYEIIMDELHKEDTNQLYDEVKYRLTDGEDINKVFYDIIHRGDYSSGLIWIMGLRIEEYLNEDNYKRFYE